MALNCQKKPFASDHRSDEILLSKDKTIAIIDGSGVLYDPAGLDRPELIRLAKARQPVSNFSKDKLGHDGYQVLVDEQDVHLPSECILLICTSSSLNER